MLNLLRQFFAEGKRTAEGECYDPPGAYTAVLLREAGPKGRFYFQKRTRKQKIFYGRLAMFGGHRENEETPEECALRELKEELGIEFRGEDLIKIGVVNTFDNRCSGAIGQLFLITDLDRARVQRRNVNAEGALVRLKPAAIARNLAKMTPVTAFAVLQYYVYEQNCADRGRG